MEGSSASQLVGLMKKFGYNREMTIEIGRVLTAPPTLQVYLAKDKLTLEIDDLIVGASAMPLAEGDMVILISDENSQMYFLLDKVVVF